MVKTLGFHCRGHGLDPWSGKILHAAWQEFYRQQEKNKIIYKGIPIRLSADFSADTLQASREWHDNVQSVEREKSAT